MSFIHKSFIFFIILILPSLNCLGQDYKLEELESMLQERRFKEALAIIDNKLQYESSNSSLYYLKAKALSGLSQFEEAIMVASKGLSFNTSSQDADTGNLFFFRGLAYSRLGNYKESVADFSKALELRPHDLNVYIEFSNAYADLNQYKDCFLILDKGLEIAPNNIYLINNYAYNKNQIGEFEEAIKYADIGLKIVKDSVWTGVFYNNRGFAKANLNQLEEGLKDINTSLNWYSNNSYAFYYRALIFIKKNEISKACADLNQCKNLGGLHLSKDLLERYCNKK